MNWKNQNVWDKVKTYGTKSKRMGHSVVMGSTLVLSKGLTLTNSYLNWFDLKYSKLTENQYPLKVWLSPMKSEILNRLITIMFSLHPFYFSALSELSWFFNGPYFELFYCFNHQSLMYFLLIRENALKIVITSSSII